MPFSAPNFMKISQIAVDIENEKEKFKQDFAKYVTSLVNTVNSDKIA